MVILRPTRKIRQLSTEPLDPEAVSDTALGDWYANRIVIDRQPLLLLISSLSLLPLLIRARDVRRLPTRLPEVVGVRLRRIGIPSEVVKSEVEAMRPVIIGPTVDRSVLGSLVDFAKSVPYYLPEAGWDDGSLWKAEDLLAETPCRVARRSEDVIFPRDKTPELLKEKWSQTPPGSTSLN